MVGMLVVETIGKIRRLRENERLPIKEICRRLGVSRKVVRKVLRSGAPEFRHERAEQPQPKLGAWSRPSMWWKKLLGLRWPRFRRPWVEVVGFRWWAAG
jgi:hypothetical protein